MSLGRVMLPLYARRWRRAASALGLAMLTAAAGVGLLGVSGWFLSGAALAGSLLAFNLFVPSALIRMLSFLRIGSRYAERIVGHDLTLRLLADLRTQVFAALMRQPPARLMQLRQGDAVAGLTSDIDTLDSVFLLVVAPLCVTLMSGLAFAAVWAAYAPWAAVAVGAAIAIAALLLPWGVMHAAYAAGWRMQHAAASTRDELLGLVHGHADLVAMGALAPARARYEQACATHRRERLRLADAAAAGQAMLHITAGACVLAVVAAGLHAWQAGALPGPVLAGLVLATLGMFEIAAPIVRGAVKWGAAAGAAQRLQRLTAPETNAKADAVIGASAADALSIDAMAGGAALCCRDLVLAHPDRGVVLHVARLALAPGERLAVVGASGSGKSTLLHALAGIVAPRAGTLTLHGRVALLSQDAPVFLGTVRTNLSIGRADADDGALWRALDAARLGDHVRGLPEGLDTWTGESGWTLSAGQARRLCLARVLLSEACVWLLDEPTAGLDAHNEQAFLAALGTCAQGRTVLVATHAPLPALAVDRVVRLAGGEAIEEIAPPSSRQAA